MDEPETPSPTLDLEAAYINPAMVQEYRHHVAVWARDAAAYREAAGGRARLDEAYGGGARQRLDIFEPASGPGGPVALFIHGGYWQTMDKSSFSHVARGANEHGITVAIAGYTLCPEATIAEIIDEIRAAVAFLARRFGGPITVYGHSAGGHLTACMLATDWRSVDPALPNETVRAGLAISGLFELEPLVSTTLNAKLGLDAAEARRVSPLLWQAPEGKTLYAYVGANESSEFLRQTRSLVARWRSLGVNAVGVELAGATHFTALAPLVDPASPMTQDLVMLARGS